MNRPIPTQYTAYQQVFDYFNNTLFENSLADCMLGFSRLRSSSHTLFIAGRWQEDAGSATAEISLNLKQLREDKPIEVMAMLVREMVHLWQEMHGRPPCNGYFNRQWAEKMETIGLIPSSTGLPGGKRTGQGIKHYIELNGRFEKAFRQMPASSIWPFRPAIFANAKRRGYSEKVMYQCPGCATKVWEKGGLGLVCECGQVFVNAMGEAKAGLGEKVYRILAEQYASEGKNSNKEVSHVES